jgi:hypothetical protein
MERSARPPLVEVGTNLFGVGGSSLTDASQSQNTQQQHVAGARTVIASGLAFPTGLAFGPDGALYVSNFGFGFPAGAGQIMRITLPD